MRFNRRELALVVGVVVVAWVAVLLVLAKWQRSQPPSTDEPELIHYPGREDIAEQRSQNLGMRKYWFAFEEDYPSKSVFYFYKNAYRDKGWSLTGPEEPQWYRRTEGGKAYDLFYALWLSPDRIFQLELQMKSEVTPIREGGQVVGEDRAPGIKVYVTQKRVMAPALILPPTQRGKPPPEIELE